VETAPRLAKRKLILDLRGVTFADRVATELLGEIYLRTNADLIAESVWTQSLAEQITRGNAPSRHQER
jgi:hypothetical protein